MSNIKFEQFKYNPISLKINKFFNSSTDNILIHIIDLNYYFKIFLINLKLK